jgi:hypothetical protein
MDIHLPILDGYESTRRIKSDPALRSIPIIAVTSYALSGGEDKDREAGCDAYVASGAGVQGVRDSKTSDQCCHRLGRPGAIASFIGYDEAPIAVRSS